jgi:tRNA pseudouridine38-40 synthase
VHARGQVAHLEIANTRLSPEQIKVSLNDELGHAINILHVEKAHPKFHARHDARSRSYTYQISKRRDAFGKKYVWWVRDTLDLGAMRNAAARSKAFTIFVLLAPRKKRDKAPWWTLTVWKFGRMATGSTYTSQASHFLWKMVRRMVGVLVEVGRGKDDGTGC